MPKAQKPYYVSPCDDDQGRTWDVFRRADGCVVRSCIRTRDEARKLVRELNGGAR